jgi:hypothetical protein
VHRALILSSLSLLLASGVHAEPVLIAQAAIDATGHDKSAQTAAPLENGVPGNLAGGLGSGLTWVGGDTFLMLPDRGPNANKYNPAVDDTASYVLRFQTVKMKLVEAAGGWTITPEITATTLLYSATPLAYGDGKAAGLPAGAPALNSAGHFYFSGRSDNFDPAKGSADPGNARLDPESIRVTADGKSVFISDEYGPHIYQFDRATGARVKVIALPDNLAVASQKPTGDAEIAGNSSGREANKGMEGLALTPDGKTLVGAMQDPLIQDGGKSAGYVRLVAIDLATGKTHEYAYALTNVGSDAKPKYTGISDILAVSDHEFWVDERDGKGLGDGSAAEFKKVFRIDLSGAQDVGDAQGAAALAAKAVAKTEVVDLVAVLKAAGVSPDTIPAKIEGLTFGPDVKIKGETRHTLWVASDNDFLATVKDPAGKTVSNPNRVFVIAVP